MSHPCFPANVQGRRSDFKSGGDGGSIYIDICMFNSIQFNNFIPDSTEHIQQVSVPLRSICYIRYTICVQYIKVQNSDSV